MSKEQRGLEGHSDEQQKEYEREARLAYDPKMVNDSINLWNSYSPEKQEAIKAEGNQIYVELAEAMDAGEDVNSDRVQKLLERWHEHIRYFYEPSLEILRGLGQLYNSDARFMANFKKINPALPAYLERVIEYYVDELETAEIERMLAEDEQM